MAISPNVSLQFQRALGRASEPKKARTSGTVTAVSSDSFGKIKNATISTGSGLISLPVPYGINVYTGMNVAIANDGTPSNAQWRLASSTSLPGGIQGGSIINHDGNTFAMFDSIWVKDDGLIIVGGDIGIDGNPSGPRVESNQCGYFGYDQYDRQSLAIYATACNDQFAGDVLLGPEEAARIKILPNDGTVSVTYNSETILEFGPDGNFLRDPLTVGNPIGARINLGEIDNKATFVLRDSSGVAKMVARTSDADSVYVHIGNPPPEDNSMWFDSANGRLNVNGHVTAQSMDVRGRATFAETGEFMIVDPDDPGRFGVITPRGQYAYTTDSLGVTHLIRVDAWGPLVLEDVFGSGNWRTWVGGSQVFGDPRYRHFRVERGTAARAGLFNGEIPVAYLDATGNGYFTGTVNANDGLIGGWTIGATSIADTAGLTGMSSAVTAGDDIRFWAGHATPGSAPFRVTKAGALTASSGTIGGWALSTAYIYQNGLQMHSNGYVKAGANNDIAMMSGADATYRFWAGHETAASAPFRVTKAGAVTATSATITGSVTATSGTIGGWTVGAASLTGGDATLHNTGYLLLGTSNDVVRLDAADATYRLWIGRATAASAPFRVTKAGALTATSATISGAITATSGSVTGSLYVGSAAPRIHIDGANKYVESTNFASGTAGFRMEGATGNAEFNNITVRGEIATSVFRKGQVVATSGTIYVTRSASIVTEACTATATTFTLKVKKQLNLAPFAAGEIVRIHGEATGASTWAVVNLGTDGTDHWTYTCYYQSGSDSATYAIGCAVLSYGPTVAASSTIPNAATATATTFTLDVNEISGAKPFATGSYVLLVEGGSSTVCTIDAGADQGTYWRYTATYVSGSNSNVYNASSPVFALGTTAPSDGRTMITSDATNSPYISIATHAAQPWTTMTEKVRLGNLTGISGASGYGLWTDNGYFTGTVNASAGSITGFLTLGSDGGIYQGSGTAASPTTGLKIWNDSGTGRIAGYNGGTIQWYANTDGKLYAGAGKVQIDSNGIGFLGAGSTPDAAALTWKSADGATTYANLWAYGTYAMLQHTSATASPLLLLEANDTATGGISARAVLYSSNGTGLFQIDFDGDTYTQVTAEYLSHTVKVQSPILALTDGVTAPSTAWGYAQIYVDTSDGDLKVKFGDGTVKTIATDS